jgi:hypothetical protein
MRSFISGKDPRVKGVLAKPLQSWDSWTAVTNTRRAARAPRGIAGGSGHRRALNEFLGDGAIGDNLVMTTAHPAARHRADRIVTILLLIAHARCWRCTASVALQNS